MSILSYLVRKIDKLCFVNYVSVRVLGFSLWFLLILNFFYLTWMICYIDKLVLCFVMIFTEHVFYNGNFILL